MSRFLGIDVGGTASRWVLADETGDVLARGEAGGATGHLFAEPERQRFSAMIAAVAAALPAGPVDGLFVGVTGFGPRALDLLRAICAPALAVDPARIAASDDVELAYRAVFAPGAGHLVAAGTGSIGLHLSADGAVTRVGGRGILIDDAGSGSWIALTALDRLYRLIDETGGTPGAERLAEALYAAVGGSIWDDVRSFVYGNDRGRIGALAQAVAEAADAGDPLARRIFADAATELARLAKALIGRVGALPVAFVGRVVKLTPSLPAGLVAALEGVPVRFPDPDAAQCAARLARAPAEPKGS